MEVQSCTPTAGETGWRFRAELQQQEKLVGKNSEGKTDTEAPVSTRNLFTERVLIRNIRLEVGLSQDLGLDTESKGHLFTDLNQPWFH